jgi:hypothetical protein
VAAVLEMRAFLEGELLAPETKVKLVQRDEVRDKVESDYIVQSVDHSIGHKVKVHPCRKSGFFKLESYRDG